MAAHFGMATPVSEAPVARQQPSEEEETSESVTVLWTCSECYVYQIPPLKTECDAP